MLDQAALAGAALSAAIAILVLLVTWRPWRPSATARLGIVGSTLAISLGYVVGQAVIDRELPALPPNDATKWPFYLALAAIPLGLLESIWRLSLWQYWTARIALVTALLWSTLYSLYQGDWDYMQAGLWTNTLAFGVLAVWASNDALAQRNSGSVMPLMALIVAIGAAAGIALTGNLRLGEYCGALAAAMGACWVISWFAPRFSLGRGAMGGFTVLLAALLILNKVYGFGQFSVAVGILFAVAPSAAWTGETRRAKLMTPGRRTALRLAAVSLVVAVAVGLGLFEHLRGSTASAGY